MSTLKGASFLTVKESTVYISWNFDYRHFTISRCVACALASAESKLQSFLSYFVGEDGIALLTVEVARMRPCFSAEAVIHQRVVVFLRFQRLCCDSLVDFLWLLVLFFSCKLSLLNVCTIYVGLL